MQKFTLCNHENEFTIKQSATQIPIYHYM